jgi:hypothetical protein
MSPTNNYLLMKSNKSNSNNDYFIEKLCQVHLRLEVLSETLGLKRPSNFFLSTMGVPIRYQILNGKDSTNVDALTH